MVLAASDDEELWNEGFEADVEGEEAILWDAEEADVAAEEARFSWYW